MESLSEVEKILSSLMDEIYEIEGVIVSSQEGILEAKVIYDDLDLKTKEINDSAFDIAVSAANLGEKIGKSALKEVIIEYEDGIILIVGQADLVLTLFLGSEARSNVGLLRVNARKALQRISRCR